MKFSQNVNKPKNSIKFWCYSAFWRDFGRDYTNNYYVMWPCITTAYKMFILYYKCKSQFVEKLAA